LAPRVAPEIAVARRATFASGQTLVTAGPVLPHPFDLVALILGIYSALRQMDVSGRHASSYPGVDAGVFERWRKLAQSAYRLGMAANFGKVLLDLVLSRVLWAFPMSAALRTGIGLSVDALWVALVILTFVRARRALAFAREHGIEKPVA
jgi:hypothetical protein